MSKLSIYFIVFLSVICCKSKINTTNPLVETNVKVIEIDSLQNVYIYYCNTENNNDVYRVLTIKSKISCKNKIIINKFYKMKLEDLSSPIYSPHIKGFWFNDTRILVKDKNNRSSPIYTTKNLEGLCYIK